MSRLTSADVIVIGAGPAGMMAAIMAARGGLNVALWDKNGFAGKKLNITGKGRCNITNLCDRDGFFKSVVSGDKFLLSAYSRFDTGDTMDFFESLGVKLKVERGGRVFPESDRARDITDALIHELERLKVKVDKRRADGLVITDGKITGITEGGNIHSCLAALVATGGMSYPLTGSTGDGYELARQAEHSIVPLVPSLVPLISPDACCGRMQGLSLKNIMLYLIAENGKKIWSGGPGEMLFTHFGVSGPLVLTASAYWRKGHMISIDLKPGLNEEMLDARILRDFKKYSNRELQNALGDLLHKNIIPAIIEKAGLLPSLRVNQVTREDRVKLMKSIKGFRLYISGLRSMDEAVVTRGGVDIAQVQPSTMESKRVKGLYFAGEILDLDATTGGFNLQIAWTTGAAAGAGLIKNLSGCGDG